ncbi:MAG: transcriptional regulator [Methanomassiliicoccaceae archaeon]|jgi:putative transcriptional regulator|nr:transcriptional regulator [Methanomassiliicoccaceae archaeon]
MGREELINATRAILARAGYSVSSPLNMRSVCFDIVGRKKESLLIIKVLSNIDAFSRENADEMKILAEALGASPILIGERSSAGTLEAGIVYSRFNISIISNETLIDHLLDDVPPFIFAAPGGLYVKLDSDLLKHLRETRGLSLGTLAETAGVSRRTIQMYETGMSAMIDAAIRLEEFLNVPIIEPMNPFEYKNEDKRREYEISGDKRTDVQIFNILLDIGCTVTPTARSPFEALTQSKKMLILTGLGNEDDRLLQKASIVSNISKISGQRSVIIVERKGTLDSIQSTAIVTKDEIKKMDDQSELKELVIERSGHDDKH